MGGRGTMDIVKAKLDIIFKKLFTDNTDLLQCLLSSLLDIPKNDITEIVIENPNTTPKYIEQKYSQLDLRLKVGKRTINIEIQIYKDNDYRERALYYWSDLYSTQLKSGEKYGLINQCLTINILNFNLFECEDYHSAFDIREKTRGEVLTDKLDIHFFELKKINHKPKSDDMKQVWLNFINAETEEELAMIEQMNIPEMNKAVAVLREMSADEQIREDARLREKALHDEASLLATAVSDEREAMLNSMRAAGLSDEQINKVLEMRNRV